MLFYFSNVNPGPALKMTVITDLSLPLIDKQKLKKKCEIDHHRDNWLSIMSMNFRKTRIKEVVKVYSICYAEI